MLVVTTKRQSSTLRVNVVVSQNSFNSPSSPRVFTVKNKNKQTRAILSQGTYLPHDPCTVNKPVYHLPGCHFCLLLTPLAMVRISFCDSLSKGLGTQVFSLVLWFPLPHRSVTFCAMYPAPGPMSSEVNDWVEGQEPGTDPGRATVLVTFLISVTKLPDRKQFEERRAYFGSPFEGHHPSWRGKHGTGT